MSKKHEKVLQNRVGLVGADNHQCNYCDDTLIFKMKDNFHEFSIGLTTILNCLSIAEQKGAIPELPRDWWISVIGHYGVVRE